MKSSQDTATLCAAEGILTFGRKARMGPSRLPSVRAYYGDHIQLDSLVCEKCVLRAVRGLAKGRTHRVELKEGVMETEVPPPVPPTVVFLRPLSRFTKDEKKADVHKATEDRRLPSMIEMRGVEEKDEEKEKSKDKKEERKPSGKKGRVADAKRGGNMSGGQTIVDATGIVEGKDLGATSAVPASLVHAKSIMVEEKTHGANDQDDEDDGNDRKRKRKLHEPRQGQRKKNLGNRKGTIRVNVVVEVPVSVNARSLRAAVDSANAFLAKKGYANVELQVIRQVDVYCDGPRALQRGIEWFLGIRTLSQELRKCGENLAWLEKLPEFADSTLTKIGNLLLQNGSHACASSLQQEVVSILSKEPVTMYRDLLSPQSVDLLLTFAMERLGPGCVRPSGRYVLVWTRDFARGATVFPVSISLEGLPCSQAWAQVWHTLTGDGIGAHRFWLGDPLLCSHYDTNQPPHEVLHALYLFHEDDPLRLAK